MPDFQSIPLLNRLPKEAVTPAAFGVGAGVALSGIGHLVSRYQTGVAHEAGTRMQKFFSRLSTGKAKGHPLFSLLAAGAIGLSLIYPTLKNSELCKRSDPDFSFFNWHNVLGIALLVGQVYLFGLRSPRLGLKRFDLAKLSDQAQSQIIRRMKRPEIKTWKDLLKLPEPDQRRLVRRGFSRKVYETLDPSLQEELVFHDPLRIGRTGWYMAGPLGLGFISGYFNQIHGKERPWHEIDLFEVAMMSFVSCFYGLGGKWLSKRSLRPIRKPDLEFNSVDYGWHRPKAWLKTFVFNTLVTGAAALPQAIWAGTNGKKMALPNTGFGYSLLDRDGIETIVYEMTWLNLVFGTMNERFIYRNFSLPSTPMAIAARQLLILGEFAAYFKWWKSGGIYEGKVFEGRKTAATAVDSEPSV